jgi:hypothetical protein
MLHKLKLIFALLASLPLFVSTANVVAAGDHIHDVLAMPPYVGSTPDHIRSAILEHISVGRSQKKDVEASFRRWGFGKTGDDRCDATEPLRLVCVSGASCPVWHLVSERFTVEFSFDRYATFRSLTVRSRFATCWGTREQ